MTFWKRGWIPSIASLALIWVSLIPLPFIAEIKFIPIDKMGHLVAFFVLSLLYLWAFDQRDGKGNLSHIKNWITFLIASFIGAFIELLQHYLPVNRFGDWMDFYFDIAGILIAIIIYPMFKRKVLRRFGLMLAVFSVLQVNGQETYITSIEYQKELSEEFANPETSPLDSVDLIKFKELDFFPVDTALRVEATLIKESDTPFFGMITTTDRRPEYRKWATVVFKWDGNEYQLTIFQNKKLMENPDYFDYLFLPFLDLTNGKTTYSGGRYIDLRIPEGDTIIIDFNKAFNPYCAYSHHYSCPVVPSENYLDFEVRAGVKKFK